MVESSLYLHLTPRSTRPKRCILGRLARREVDAWRRAKLGRGHLSSVRVQPRPRHRNPTRGGKRLRLSAGRALRGGSEACLGPGPQAGRRVRQLISSLFTLLFAGRRTLGGGLDMSAASGTRHTHTHARTSTGAHGCTAGRLDRRGCAVTMRVRVVSARRAAGRARR